MNISLYETQGYLTSGVILFVKLMQKSYVKKKKKCGFLFLHAGGPAQCLVQLSWWGQPETLFLGRFYLLYLLRTLGKMSFVSLGGGLQCQVTDILWLQRK